MSNKSNVIGGQLGSAGSPVTLSDVVTFTFPGTTIVSDLEATYAQNVFGFDWRFNPVAPLAQSMAWYGSGGGILLKVGEAGGVTFAQVGADAGHGGNIDAFTIYADAFSLTVGAGTFTFDGNTLFINGSQTFSKSAGNPPSVGNFAEGLVCAALDKIDFQIAATGNLCSARGDGYYFGANKIVGARGAAVADATGAGDVVAQLNALLARCRAHGLIA